MIGLLRQPAPVLIVQPRRGDAESPATVQIVRSTCQLKTAL